MKKNRKGFTLIEILMIIAIISILVSVVLVALISTKQKARDNSALLTMKSLPSPIYMCLSSGWDLNTSPISGTSICSGGLDNAKWPDFSKYDWSNSVADPYKKFAWCAVNSPVSTRPTVTGAYNGTTIGGNPSTSTFCFMFQNYSKYVWCTANGCGKEGF